MMFVMQGWPALVVAGLLDVAWAISMKYAQGYTKPGWSVVSVLLLGAFVFLLGRALQTLPVGSAYAVWTGIGAVGAFALGVYLFDEPLGSGRIVGVALVLLGIIILKLT